MVTGESRPVRRSVGDSVVAGTVATDSGLRVKVTAVGDDTALAGIQRLVTEAQNSSSRAQRLADTGGGLAVLVRARSGDRDRGGVGLPRAARRGRDPHHHGAGDRLPARPRPGDPAGGVHRDRTRRPRRGADQGPAGAGEHAHRRRGAVRQDRHADQGRAHGDGRRRHGRSHRGRGAGDGGRGRVRLRASAGPGHRRRRAAPRADGACVVGLHVVHRPSA